MKRFISTVLLASMTATVAPAWAQDPAPMAIVTPLGKGQPAPYAGVLMSPPAVAKVVAEKEAAAKALVLAVQRQAELDEARLKFEVDGLTTSCNADKQILQAQVDESKRRINMLNDQLEKETKGPGPGTWLGVGVAGGVVVTLIAVFAASRVAN